MACSLLTLSIITINIAPMISKSGSEDIFKDWSTANCQLLSDEDKREKDNGGYSSKPKEEQAKRIINECGNHKLMYGFEIAAFVIDVSLGFVCSLLGLIHFLEPGKDFEKISGLIGLIVGIISAIITIIYVAISGVIFNTEPIRNKTILYPNQASLHWNGNKYIYDYDTEAAKEDLDIPSIKYKDLGKIQYNYDSELFKASKDANSEYYNCKRPSNNFDSLSSLQTYTVDGHNKECNYIWETNQLNTDSENKYLYDRWITSIILSVFISACGLGLAIFGFLLFKGSSNSASSPSPLPQK